MKRFRITPRKGGNVQVKARSMHSLKKRLGDVAFAVNITEVKK